MMSQPSRPDHDALYHRLFSDPGVVAQLLRALVAGPGGAGIDFSDHVLDGSARLNAKFNARTGGRHEGDMIRRTHCFNAYRPSGRAFRDP